MAGLVKRWTQQDAALEQRVPAWDRPRQRSTGHESADPVERAILDIEYNDGGVRRWLDVSVRHPAAGSAADIGRAARRCGEAARRGERCKHIRYPGEELTAFVVEACGRLGGEARQWLQKQTRELPEETQVAELGRAYQVVSCAVQAQQAWLLRSAAGLK